MMTNKKFLALFIFISTLLSSCSEMLWNEKEQEKSELESFSCSYKNKKIILSPSDEIAKSAKLFFTEKNINDELEQLIYLTLLHIKFFPHQVSPTSSFLFVEHKEGNQKVYMNTYSQKKPFPLLDFLNYLSQKSKKSLAYYLKFLNDHFINTPKVTPSLHDFVKTHLNTIKSNEALAAFYLRGNDPINVGESLPVMDLSFLNELSKGKNHLSLDSVYFFPLPDNNKIKCSFDSNLYKHTIYPSRDDSLESLSFALLGKGSQSYFVSIFQKKSEPLLAEKIAPFFVSIPYSNFPAICLNEASNEQSYALSLEGRDPAQHLFHLLQNGLMNKSETSAINAQLNMARYIYLNNPRRMLVESHIASSKMLSELLSKSFPLYHISKLGEIIFNRIDNAQLHIDARAKFTQNCSE